MTTIVVDRKNRCLLQNSHYVFQRTYTEKGPVVHIPGGGLFTVTGDLSYSEVRDIAHWICNAGTEKPDLHIEPDQSFNIIGLLNSGETRFYFPDFSWVLQMGEVFAYGSGSIMAITALYCGKNPYDAVNIACGMDPDTHGSPVVWHLDRGQITQSEYLSLVT